MAEKKEVENNTEKVVDISKEEMQMQFEQKLEEAKAEMQAAFQEQMQALMEKTTAVEKKAEAATELNAGQKQAILERNFHNAMEEAKKDKVKIELPIDMNSEDNDVFVCVNGESYLIKRGEEVEVPKFVADVLKNSSSQRVSAKKLMMKLEETNREKTKQYNP